MQHLVVRTSQPAHLLANDWRSNGVGRQGTLVSSKAVFNGTQENEF